MADEHGTSLSDAIARVTALFDGAQHLRSSTELVGVGWLTWSDLRVLLHAGEHVKRLDDASEHRSDCAINNKPASDQADCACDPLVRIMVVRKDDKYAQFQTWNTLATSWQANFLVEVVRGLSGPWPTGPMGSDGSTGQARMPPVAEVIDRATAIVDATVAEVYRRQWVARTPSPEELREKDDAPVGVRPGYAP